MFEAEGCSPPSVIGPSLRHRGLDAKADGLHARAAVYHLHQPWSILNSFIDGIFLLAHPSRRFQSAWMGIIVRSVQSPFLIIIIVLTPARD